MKLEEIKGNKNFKEFCEFSGYDIDKIVNNIGSNFAIELLDENDEEYTSLDMNYPYIIYNPFGIDIMKD